MAKYHLIILFLFLLFPAFAYADETDNFRFYGDASLEFAYDSNIEGATDHSIPGETNNKLEDFLTVADLNLGIIKSFSSKINLNASFSEIEKFYTDEYIENSNRHIGEIDLNIPISKSLTLTLNDRVMFHSQPKEDLHDFFANFATSSLSYDITKEITVSAGYLNRFKKYPNNKKWNFIRDSFFLQTRYQFSQSFWVTGTYEGSLYRGNNNLFFEPEEQNELEKEEISLFKGKTSKGHEHQIILTVNKILEKGSLVNFKYRFVSNSVNDVTNILEDRELAEFEGILAYENDEQDFNYTLNEATLILSIPFPEKLTLDVIMLYQFQNFDGDAFGEEVSRTRRLDRLAVADISLSYNLIDNLAIALRQAFINNESNYPEKEYSRNYTSVNFKYSF